MLKVKKTYTVCECCTMDHLSCRNWLLHESKVDNLLILFFQLGNRINRKAENDHDFLSSWWFKAKHSREVLKVWKVFRFGVLIYYRLAFIFCSVICGKTEKTSLYCNIYNTVWHFMTLTKPKWWDAAETWSFVQMKCRPVFQCLALNMMS